VQSASSRSQPTINNIASTNLTYLQLQQQLQLKLQTQSIKINYKGEKAEPETQGGSSVTSLPESDQNADLKNMNYKNKLTESLPQTLTQTLTKQNPDKTVHVNVNDVNAEMVTGTQQTRESNKTTKLDSENIYIDVA